MSEMLPLAEPLERDNPEPGHVTKKDHTGGGSRI